MGSGGYSKDTYEQQRSTRKATGTPDFDYSARATDSTPIHPALDPKRIKNKPFGMLESCDSKEHPESRAVFVSFDVTGSNYLRAVDAQKKLSNLMDLLTEYLPNPQVAVAANDDIHFVGNKAVQISDFESDNRIDAHIRNILLTKQGGGNDGESYDLILYAAAFHTKLDCWIKRKQKGYFFMYADEPIFDTVEADHVRNIFGDDVQGNLPIHAVISKLKETFTPYIIWPTGGYDHARQQYVALFGNDNVVTLQHPNLICEMIASLVGLNEHKVNVESLDKSLVRVGVSQQEVRELRRSLPASIARAAHL